MVDIIREVMNFMLADASLMKMLRNNKDAICRIRSPNADIKPRIDLSLLDDGDGEYYDGKPTVYAADIGLAIWKADSQLFEIAERVDALFNNKYFERLKHRDGYNYQLELYFKEMVYRTKVLINGDDFSWLKR